MILFDRYSHDFLVFLQSCYLIATVDKPTRVHINSATFIDNIFVNNPDQVITSGNIISDISDHFSQFCIIRSARDKINIPKMKVRDFSRFSPDQLNNDLSQVGWNELKNGLKASFPPGDFFRAKLFFLLSYELSAGTN